MEASEQKVVLITGGSSGIGNALAREFLSGGYRVLITARSGDLSHLHPAIEVIPLELTDQQSIEHAADQIFKLVKGIDVLVNNAGIAEDVFTEKPDFKVLQHTLDVNVTGTIYFTELLSSHLNPDAQIVNISSEMGLLHKAGTNGPAYRISKAALNFYGKMLSALYADREISVLTIHPGWVRTKLGGDQAPLSAEWSAGEIFRTIQSRPLSGQFINVHTKEQFAL